MKKFIWIFFMIPLAMNAQKKDSLKHEIIADWILVYEFSSSNFKNSTLKDTISLCKYACRQYKKDTILYYTFKSNGTFWCGYGEYNEAKRANVTAKKIKEEKLGDWKVDENISMLIIKYNDKAEIKFQILPSDIGTLILTIDKRNPK